MLSPVPRDLTSILAARKAQVSQARTQDLIGLRRAGDVDSDDDDDDDDEALESKVAAEASTRPWPCSQPARLTRD